MEAGMVCSLTWGVHFSALYVLHSEGAGYSARLGAPLHIYLCKILVWISVAVVW